LLCPVARNCAPLITSTGVRLWLARVSVRVPVTTTVSCCTVLTGADGFAAGVAASAFDDADTSAATASLALAGAAAPCAHAALLLVIAITATDNIFLRTPMMG
jgi:hypothetical protein